MKKLLACLGALCALAVTACGDSAPSSAATVDGHTISIREVNGALDRFAKGAQFDQLTQQQDPEELKRTFQQGYLAQLIRREVLRGLAQERDITVSDKEISDQLTQIQAQFGGKEQFEKAAADQGLSDEQLNELVRDQIIEQKLREDVTAGLTPTDAELQDYYDSHLEEFKQTRASHILVEKEKQAARISGLLQRAKPKELDVRFAFLAKKFSSDPGSAAKGGDLGFFAPGDFVAEFEQAADELKVDEVSDPVRSEFGWHVIMVTDRRTEPFDKVKDQIASQLGGSNQESAFNEFIVDAYRDADIEVNPRFGELDVQTQQIVDSDASDTPGAEDPGSTPAPTGSAPAPSPTT